MDNKRAQTADIAERRFGRRMRQERERLGLTQLQLAERIRSLGVDLHPSAIAKMEDRNAVKPRGIRLSEAAAIAEVFGLSISEMTRPQRDDLARLAEQARDVVANNNRAMASWIDLHRALDDVADEASAEAVKDDDNFKVFSAIHDQSYRHLVEMAEQLAQVPGGSAIMRRVADGETIDPGAVASAPWVQSDGGQ
ncbi:MAG: helix-turn-helix transcriptional regulator [Actinomycetes bacterium]